MSLNKTATLVTALLGVMAFGTAAAQNTPPAKKAPSQTAQPAQASSSPSTPTFSQLDRNHDGRLTRSEIPHKMHALREHFRQYDRDGNGSLSKKEYELYAHPPKVRQF